MADALAWRLRAQSTFVPESRPGDVMLEAAAAIEAILALHSPVEDEAGVGCAECYSLSYPCATILALNETKAETP